MSLPDDDPTAPPSPAPEEARGGGAPVGSAGAMFRGYIRSKASTLTRLGVELYREADALGMPPEHWPPSDLLAVVRGCEQILDGKGLTQDRPFEGLSVGGCHALMATLHFEVAGRRSKHLDREVVDELQWRHRVDSSITGVLYNRVSYDD